jgi:hypothetical protein
MVVITTRSVTGTQPFIVPVPVVMLVLVLVAVVIVVVRRVLVAGMTTLRVGFSHARLPSKAVCL